MKLPENSTPPLQTAPLRFGQPPTPPKKPPVETAIGTGELDPNERRLLLQISLADLMAKAQRVPEQSVTSVSEVPADPTLSERLTLLRSHTRSSLASLGQPAPRGSRPAGARRAKLRKSSLPVQIVGRYQ